MYHWGLFCGCTGPQPASWWMTGGKGRRNGGTGGAKGPSGLVWKKEKSEVRWVDTREGGRISDRKRTRRNTTSSSPIRTAGKEKEKGR